MRYKSKFVFILGIIFIMLLFSMGVVSASEIKSIKLTPSNASIESGKTLKLETTITPSDYSSDDLTWSTSNKDIAIVTKSGIVIGTNPGVALITVKSSNNVKAFCVVEVKQKNVSQSNQTSTTKIDVSDIKITPAYKEIEQGERLSLVATISPSNATNKKLTWKSNNTKVAAVSSSGIVIGTGAGTAVITAQSSNGKKAVCVVGVKAKPISQQTNINQTNNNQTNNNQTNNSQTVTQTQSIEEIIKSGQKLTGAQVGEIMANAAKIMLKHKSSFGYNVDYGGAATRKVSQYWKNSSHVISSSKKQLKYFMNCEGFCKTVIRWSLGVGRTDICATYNATGKAIGAPAKSMVINGKKYSGGTITDSVIQNLRPGDILIWRGRAHLAMYVGNGRIIEIVDSGVREASVKTYNGSRVLRYVWRPTNELAAKLDTSKIDLELTKVKW
ncbi:MAG: Ig domain-containing protein [Clostridia bacterium]|nr:Ig domain-containing protein [Clostridia bacterium]